MGLITTAAIIAVVAIVAAGIIFIGFHVAAPSGKLTALQAENLVVNDIKAQNPSSNVTVISVSNSTLAAGSWQMTLSVVYNGSKPCPTVLIEQFDYPATGLHPSNDTQASSYSSGTCSIYIYGSLPPYAPLFIASSYASKNPSIVSYVTTFGYENTFVTATLAPAQGYAPTGNSVSNAVIAEAPENWLVRYKATNANYSLYAILGQSGSITQIYNATG